MNIYIYTYSTYICVHICIYIYTSIISMHRWLGTYCTLHLLQAAHAGLVIFNKTQVTAGHPWSNIHSIGKPWENHRKTIGKP